MVPVGFCILLLLPLLSMTFHFHAIQACRSAVSTTTLTHTLTSSTWMLLRAISKLWSHKGAVVDIDLSNAT